MCPDGKCVPLGAECCFLSVVGGDDAGREVKRLSGESERVEAHLLVERDRVTTVKTRYIAGTQQMLRADRETVAPIDGRKRFSVVVLGADATHARLRLDSGAEIALSLSDLRRARLVLTDELIAATAQRPPAN